MGVGGHRHFPAALLGGRDSVPIVQEAGWTTKPVRTGAENVYVYDYTCVVLTRIFEPQ
jgi:hypothetical protein